jgi:hypothetical protein
MVRVLKVSLLKERVLKVFIAGAYAKGVHCWCLCLRGSLLVLMLKVFIAGAYA